MNFILINEQISFQASYVHSIIIVKHKSSKINIFLLSDNRERDRSGNRNPVKPDSRAKPFNRKEVDPDKPLSREELERERPQVKPWDINPEFVPKGHSYFEVNI